MIKILDLKFKYDINIIYTNLIDNILHIVYYYDTRRTREIYLLKMNTITQVIINIHILTNDFIEDPKVYRIKIINNNIYLFSDSTQEVYNFEGILINKYNFSTTNIIEINNKLYFIYGHDLISCEPYYDNDGYDEYNFLLSIKYNSEKNYIDYNDIYLRHREYKNVKTLNLKIDGMYKILCYDNNLIFRDKQEGKNKLKIVVYNLLTEKFVEFDYFKILNNFKFLYYDDDIVYVYDYPTNTTYLLSEDLTSFLEYNLNHVCDNYYSSYDNSSYDKYDDDNECIFELYYDDKILLHKINLSEKYIKVGNIENNVEIQIEYLLKNSDYFKGLLDDIETNEIIYSKLENMDLYKEYIINGIENIDDLYNLFKISNLVLDKNIKIIALKILEKIKYEDVDIDKIFDYLEIFSTSVCDNQFLSLFYLMIEKYDIDDVLFKFRKIDKNTKLYELCFEELLKYKYNSKKYHEDLIDNILILS